MAHHIGAVFIMDGEYNCGLILAESWHQVFVLIRPFTDAYHLRCLGGQ